MDSLLGLSPGCDTMAVSPDPSLCPVSLFPYCVLDDSFSFHMSASPQSRHTYRMYINLVPQAEQSGASIGSGGNSEIGVPSEEPLDAGR